jgi:hypothetical protein
MKKTLEVVCRSCAGSFHITNSKYDPTRPTNATMLTFKEPWKTDYGWTDFPHDESIGYESLICPSCNVSYCNGAGYVETRETDYVDPDAVKSVAPIVDGYIAGKTGAIEGGFVPSTGVYKEPDRTPCPVCGKEFTAAGLKRHIGYKHPEYNG